MAVALALALAPLALGSTSFDAFATQLRALQTQMIAAAQAADPSARWSIDPHDRGKAAVLEGGELWEKGCVSITHIPSAELSAVRAASVSGRTGTTIAPGTPYSACALSFVLHATSPLVPTLRGDVRVFVVGDEQWYGGGLDLTPSYVEEEDCRYFHRALAELCTRHASDSAYDEMKATCDEYFYLPARAEHRGVGGIFFDDLTEEWAPSFAKALIEAALHEEGPYMPIVRKRLPLEFTKEQKEWQLLRRGRYVEFNLLYDRGVKFGLTPESVERVLVSSPPLVAFKYKAEPPAGSAEAKTLEVLRNPRDWINA